MTPFDKAANTGVRRIVRAWGHSIAGLQTALTHEAAFRQELFLFIILVPLAVWLGDNRIEQLLMIGSLIIILVTELVNSAIEAAIDRIGSEFHEYSKRAKDLGSAAVLMAMVFAMVVWAGVLTA